VCHGTFFLRFRADQDCAYQVRVCTGALTGPFARSRLCHCAILALDRLSSQNRPDAYATAATTINAVDAHPPFPVVLFAGPGFSIPFASAPDRNADSNQVGAGLAPEILAGEECSVLVSTGYEISFALECHPNHERWLVALFADVG
jgi:hypothetical protein